MKTKRYVYAMPFLAALLVLAPLCGFNSGTNPTCQSATGQASSVGSPGELGTCSRSNCHGAGNGSSTTGGLPDNGGPGSISISSVPAMAANNYVPGQLYHMTVTVAQTGVVHFGFGCEILDNSGSSNNHINNTAGTITVTDAAHTTTWQAYGTGRLSVTHNSGGGLTSNTASFNFDWTAPGSGTVNVYLSGNATNNNGKSDAPDNVYTLTKQWTPLATSVSENKEQDLHLSAYPIPATDHLTLSLVIHSENQMGVSLVSLDGKETKVLENRTVGAGPFSQEYSLAGFAKGVYFLRVTVGSESQSRMVVVQ
jgi:hypothetical protein